ncbi:hypothetical protein HDU76_006746 [Blyttiomyces sp. JEL0837]|nr:hypothetical protein HDU76_006746 [Blyttiomyces sp. JEL0837]
MEVGSAEGGADSGNHFCHVNINTNQKKRGRRDPSRPLAVVLRSRKSNPAELVSKPEASEVETPSEPPKSTFDFSTMKVIQRGSYSLRNVANRQRAEEESSQSKTKESGGTNTTGNVKSGSSGKRVKKRRATTEEMDVIDEQSTHFQDRTAPSTESLSNNGVQDHSTHSQNPPGSHASSTVVDAAEGQTHDQEVNEHEAGEN